MCASKALNNATNVSGSFKGAEPRLSLYLNSNQSFDDADYDDDSENDDDDFHLYSKTCSGSTDPDPFMNNFPRHSSNNIDTVESEAKVSALLKSDSFNWAEDVEEEEAASELSNGLKVKFGGLAGDETLQKGKSATTEEEEEKSRSYYQAQVEEVGDALRAISQTDDDHIAMIGLGLEPHMRLFKQAVFKHFNPGLQGYGPLAHLFETKFLFNQLSQRRLRHWGRQLCQALKPVNQCHWQLVPCSDSPFLKNSDNTATIPKIILTDDTGEIFTLNEKIDRHSEAKIQEIRRRRSERQPELKQKFERWDLNGGVRAVGGTYAEQRCARAARNCWHWEQKEADAKWLKDHTKLLDGLEMEVKRKQELTARARVVPKDRLLAVRQESRQGPWHWHQWGVCSRPGCRVIYQEDSDLNSDSDSDLESSSAISGDSDSERESTTSSSVDEEDSVTTTSLPNLETRDMLKFRNNVGMYTQVIRPLMFDQELNTIVEDWEMEEDSQM